MFNFQHFQIIQQEFEQLAEFFFKYPIVYATSKFDVGKYIHHYTFHLNLRNFQETTRKYCTKSLTR